MKQLLRSFSRRHLQVVFGAFVVSTMAILASMVVFSFSKTEHQTVPSLAFKPRADRLVKDFSSNQNRYYPRDGQIFYEGSSRPIEQADVETFETLSIDCARDKNTGYWKDQPVGLSDPASFQCFWPVYQKDQRHVFYMGKSLDVADPATFVVLEFGYARDASHVFHGERMLQADPLTFAFVETKEGNSIDVYTKDETHVYFRDQMIEGADPKTFHYLGSLTSGFYDVIHYGADEAHVYRNDDREDALDPKTTRLLGLGYLKDATHVYFDQNEVSGADPSSFEVILELDERLVQDKNFFYLLGERLGPRRSDLKQSEWYYAIYPNAVYYRGERIQEADSNSFAIIGGFGIFEEEMMEKGGGYAKDASHVYVNGQVLSGANPKTFELTNRVGYARDDRHEYAFGEIIKNDFVSCSTFSDLSASEEKMWTDKIRDLQNDQTLQLDKVAFEYCVLPNGSKLMAYQADWQEPEGERRTRNFHLLDPENRLMRNEPAVFVCKAEEYARSVWPSIVLLDDRRVKVQCEQGDACIGRNFFWLNLETLKSPATSSLFTPITDEYYDCGYRG